MDAVHLHLLLNHAPAFWSIVGIVLFLFGLLRGNRTALISGLVLFVVIAVLVPVVYYSGHSAEELVEDVPGFSGFFLEKHASAAEFVFYLGVFTGFLSIVAIYMELIRKFKDMLYRITMMLVFLSSFSLFVSSIIAGGYGGKIRHSEILSPDEASKMDLHNSQDDHSH